VPSSVTHCCSPNDHNTRSPSFIIHLPLAGHDLLVLCSHNSPSADKLLLMALGLFEAHPLGTRFLHTLTASKINQVQHS